MRKTASENVTDDSPAVGRKKRRPWWRIALRVFILLFVIGACVRPMLPWVVRRYVNRTLDRNLDYEGRIGDVTLNLWRGAYSISNVRLSKRVGNVPVPLFSAKEVELAVQWNAILHGKIVGQVVINQPTLNFVDSSADSESQTGAGAPWLATIADLFPFKINSVQIHKGSVHFRSYLRAKPVDVYLSKLESTVDDLTNVRDARTPLLTTVNAAGLAMDQAPFEFHMKLDPFSYRPSFDMAMRLLGLDVTKTNDLAHAYGQFEFKGGWFDLVVEASAREGQIEGTVKPLFRKLVVFDIRQDVKDDDNPLQFFWQAILGVTTGVFKNHPRDQFGTSIPFTGDLTAPDTDILATIGNVLRNAFVRAYLPKLDQSDGNLTGMRFGAGSITGPTSVGDEQ
jgi:Domain of Unknown Function (DUF748)